MLRDMLGPDNNMYLDKILTYKMWPLLVNVSVFSWSPNVYSGFSNKGPFVATPPTFLEHYLWAQLR